MESRSFGQQITQTNGGQAVFGWQAVPRLPVISEFTANGGELDAMACADIERAGVLQMGDGLADEFGSELRMALEEEIGAQASELVPGERAAIGRHLRRAQETGGLICGLQGTLRSTQRELGLRADGPCFGRQDHAIVA